jgi:hypothetical protein
MFINGVPDLDRIKQDPATDFVVRDETFRLESVKETNTDPGGWIGKNLFQAGVDTNKTRWRTLI